MATTASTSLLGLALPVTGELDGTWGTVVNDSITSLVDSAIAGTTTLSADADVTLTTTALAANTAREAVLLWTAGGSSTRYITAPAQSKTYVVINQSSSTQSIVLRGDGPTTGVTIIKGESAVCAWNGSDFVKVSNASGAGTFTDLTVTGNTILGDAGTDTVRVNGTIGVGGAALSNKAIQVQNTLTGSNPLGIDVRPTITATGGSVMSSLVTGGGGSLTANTGGAISAYGCYLSEPNVVVTSGSVTNAATVFINEGPTEGGTLNANLYTNAATGTNKWNIYASGTADNYFAGDVGIGTSAPSQLLNVEGSSNGSIGALIYNSNNLVNTEAKLELKHNRGNINSAVSVSAVANAGGTADMKFVVVGTERMRIDSSGNVGIGTTSPVSKLHVYGTGQIGTIESSGDYSSSGSGFIRYKDSTGNRGYVGFGGTSNLMTISNTLTSGVINFETNGAERARIDSSGNVLIGTTTSPAGSKELVLGGDYIEGVVAIGNSATAKTISLANGTVQTVTLTGNCTFTMPTAVAGKSFTVILSTGAGSFTSTFTSVKWPNNTAPTITTTASRWDILSFISDGTNWYGNFAQAYQ